ncbi:MAG: hypothetical protein IJ797_09680 [Selenomonadaceae bacterium]|nr:hypothetical protein [Selenomonadaceae bacterium]
MNRGLMSAAAILIMFTSSMYVSASTADDEIAIMAAKQQDNGAGDAASSNGNDVINGNSGNVNVDNNGNDSAGEQANNSDNNNASNTQDNNTVNPDIDLVNANNGNVNNETHNDSNSNTVNGANSSNEVNVPNNGANNNAGVSNSVVSYANFNEAAQKVGYIPLYIPKKSGYTMNYIAVINNKIIEIRYGRRWEPKVTLAVRTYKRNAGEAPKDISGISGVKWKIDVSSGTTIYIARVNDNTNVAAWSYGQYTFAAITENLSFAAFHSLIIDELVDLCSHYFIDL